MGLETATHIFELNADNPDGAADPKAQGDDHIRMIKLVLLTDLPNIEGVVNASHTELNILAGAVISTTELNYLDGVTSAIQTQLNNKAATSHAHSASDITSGTLADGRVAASNVTQHANSIAAAISGGVSIQGVARNISSKAGTSKTLSSSGPSGGSDGDIWYRY